MSQPVTVLHAPRTPDDVARDIARERASQAREAHPSQRGTYPRATYLDSRRTHPSGGGRTRGDDTDTATAQSEATSSAAGSVDLREAFRGAAASTWVITAAGETGPVGFTAVSVASVSLSPPLVSFNLTKNSSSLVTLARTGAAALHLLAAGQEDLAHRFAGDRAQRFVADQTWRYDDHGLPWVNDVAVRLVTQLVDLVDTGDSFLAVARVLHTRATGQPPLLRYQGDYRSAVVNGVEG